MKKIFSILFLACIVLLQACSNNDDSTDPTPVSITVSDFSTSLDENPTTGTVIGTVSASASDGSTLTYTLSNENVSGALAINANTGEITVADVVAFDFESNPSITASYTASNGTESATGSISITLNDVVEGFKFTWETTTVSESMTIPTNSTLTYNYTVDWGDGNTSTETGDATHTYTTAETYQVTITGTFPAIRFGNTSSISAKVLSIDQWGDIEWESMESAFANCIEMTYQATDRPNLSKVTDMSNMFKRAYKFNGAIGNWDVSKVTNMTGVFFDARIFNQALNNWDVSQVTNMGLMFRSAFLFNQPLNNWDVSKVTNMAQMFRSATAFNQALNNWNDKVSNVTRMEFMFMHTPAFNQDLSGWSVANVMFCNSFSDSGLAPENLPNFTNCTP